MQGEEDSHIDQSRQEDEVSRVSEDNGPYVDFSDSERARQVDDEDVSEHDHGSLHSRDSEGFFIRRRPDASTYPHPCYDYLKTERKTPDSDYNDTTSSPNLRDIFPIPSSGMHSQSTMPTAADCPYVDTSDRDLVPLFISHAQVYAFAHLYDVTELMHRAAFCLKRAHERLRRRPIDRRNRAGHLRL